VSRQGLVEVLALVEEVKELEEIVSPDLVGVGLRRLQLRPLRHGHVAYRRLRLRCMGVCHFGLRCMRAWSLRLRRLRVQGLVRSRLGSMLLEVRRMGVRRIRFFRVGR